MKTKLTFSISLIIVLILPFVFNHIFDVKAFIDFVVFIDAGHGGKDNGTSYMNVYEDEINLSIASKLYEKCINKNFYSYLSRTNDYDLASLYSTNRKNEDLKKRAEIINHSGSDIFVSIHVNFYKNSSIHGPMVYYQKDNNESYLLSTYIQKELNYLTNENKKVHNDNFYLFKVCETPGVLVECGFISNDQEREKLISDMYQDSIAEAIYQGIYNYYLKM